MPIGIDFSCDCTCGEGDGSGSGSETYILCADGVTRRRVPLAMRVTYSGFPTRCLWPNTTYYCDSDSATNSFGPPIANGAYACGLIEVDDVADLAYYRLGSLSFNDIVSLAGLPLPDVSFFCYQNEPEIYQYVGNHTCANGGVTYDIDAYLGIRVIVAICGDTDACSSLSGDVEVQSTGVYVVTATAGATTSVSVVLVRSGNGFEWDGTTCFLNTDDSCTTTACILSAGSPTFAGSFVNAYGTVSVVAV